jgi:hypothetical protein
MSNVDLTPTLASGGLAARREEHFEQGAGSVAERLTAFPKYVDRTSLSRFIVKAEIFERIRGVQGSILELGVHLGGGLFTWAQLSAIHEPLNHRRRVVGFDTFEGFPDVDDRDVAGGSSDATAGGYRAGSEADVRRGIELYDADRTLGDIPKIDVVVGDFTKTGPEFLASNPHLVVSLMYLDFDLYEPTKLALQLFRDHIPKGGVIAFDEVNVPEWPGETQALHEVLGIGTVRLERLPFSSICWAVLD